MSNKIDIKSDIKIFFNIKSIIINIKEAKLSFI